jgi:hypothetical protein
MTGDTDVLIGFLDSQREHALGILEGLSDEDLRRAILPSDWNCLGTVKHLALDVEHYWIQCIVAGESLDFFSQPALLDNGAWRVAPSETSEEIFDLNLRFIVLHLIEETACHAGHLDAARELIDGRQWMAFDE